VRKVLLVLIFFLLCGCNSYNKQTDLDAVFLDSTSEYRQNNFSEYLDYYLPSDMIEEEFAYDHVVFNFDRNKVVMNIDIASVIANKYYKNYVLTDDGYFDQSKIVYSYSGSYTNHDKNDVKFFYKVYDGKDYNILYFKSENLTFYGYCFPKDLIDMTSKIYTLAKSASIKTDNIISKYSTKDVIDYSKTQIDLFDVIMPNSGRIDDLIKEDITSN